MHDQYFAEAWGARGALTVDTSAEQVYNFLCIP